LGRWHGAVKGPAAYLSSDVYLTVAKRVLAHGIKPFISTAQVGGPCSTASRSRRRTTRTRAGSSEGQAQWRRHRRQDRREGRHRSLVHGDKRTVSEISYTNGQQWSLDFSALHFALSPLSCNIHIDEFGVVLSTATEACRSRRMRCTTSETSHPEDHHQGISVSQDQVARLHRPSLLPGAERHQRVQKIGGGFDEPDERSRSTQASAAYLDNDSAGDAGLLINTTA
jgi:hypothetical protein